MKKIALPSRGAHQFHFPEDIIKNDENMKSQRNKKSYWHTYSDMLWEIHETNPTYDPFPNYKDSAKIVRAVLNQFVEIYDTLNEKCVYGKKVKLTIIQDKEDLDKLVQIEKIVQKEESGNKRRSNYSLPWKIHQEEPAASF